MEIERYINIFIAQKEAIKINIDKMTEKLSKMKNNTDLVSKLSLLQNQLDDITNSIDTCLAKIDTLNDWELTEEDKDRIKSNELSEKMFRQTLPYLTLMQVMNWIVNDT